MILGAATTTAPPKSPHKSPPQVDQMLEMTIPGKPNSRLQKYRLTGKGLRRLQQQGAS
jgi:hypothetical protein